jgi:hypothetical protein
MVITNTATTPSHVLVTLTGYDEAADELVERVVPFFVPASDTNMPQIMRQDVTPNFNAEYITMRIQAWSVDEVSPAPKIHAIRVGVKDRATTIRHGGPAA